MGDHRLALLCAGAEGKYKRILWDLESGETGKCDMAQAVELEASPCHFQMYARKVYGIYGASAG